MHGRTQKKVEQPAELVQADGVVLPPVEQFHEVLRRLEIDQMFQVAEEMGLDRLAGHILAEANLDFVTDGPFDLTDEELAGDEPF